MRLARFHLAAIVAFAGIGSVQAIPIVDTGASPFVGPADPGGSLFGSWYLTNFEQQYLAGRFTTTEDFRITSLSAFVRNYSCCSVQTHELTLSLATGSLSASGSQFTDLIALPTSIELTSGAAGWADVGVNDFLLSAGTYWIVASVQMGQRSVGLGMPNGVPRPLDAHAYYSDVTDDWRPYAGTYTAIPANLGFRVNGDRVSVPEPDSLALFGGAIAAMWSFRRRRLRDVN